MHYKRFIRGATQEEMLEPPQIKDPSRDCSVKGCKRPYAAKGLCMLHYKRKWRAETEDDDETV